MSELFSSIASAWREKRVVDRWHWGKQLLNVHGKWMGMALGMFSSLDVENTVLSFLSVAHCLIMTVTSSLQAVLSLKASSARVLRKPLLLATLLLFET